MKRDTQSQVISLRLNADLAREFKVEAARRGMKLNVMFEDMFRLYLKEADSDGSREENTRDG